MKPQSLTDEELNRWIAEKEGYKWHDPYGDGEQPLHPDGYYVPDEAVPHYCADLNAIQAVLDDLEDKARTEIVLAFWQIHTPRQSAATDAMFATARQRSEAFYIVKGGER